MMNPDLALARPDLEQLPEYHPTFPVGDGVIKLDANENPYGPSPRALAALAAMRSWHYYPAQQELRAALANYVGLRVENIVVTNGADEALDLLLRAILAPGEVVVDCPPSFQMYRSCTLANRGVIVQAPRRPDFSLDVDRVVESAANGTVKAVLLASPNNPDGSLLSQADLARLLELPALIVIDEAYAEFAGESAVGRVAEQGNLVIVRTFSKWAALAGLRVGYAVLPVALATAIQRLKAPYNVNAAGVVAACASLEDREYLMENVRRIVAERERMLVELARFPFLHPYPSRANFLLCRVSGLQAHWLAAELARRQILVRTYDSAPMGDFLRLTIGRPEQNDAVLCALEEIAHAG